MNITTENDGWQLNIGHLNLTEHSAGIQILDGHSESLSSLSKPENIKLSDEKMCFSQSGNDFQVIQSIIADNDVGWWSVRIKNQSESQLWHEVRLTMDIQKDKSLRYWDGYSDRGPVSTDHVLAENANPVGNEQPLPDKRFPLSEDEKAEILRKSGGNSQAVMNVMFGGPTKMNVFPMSCVFNENHCICLGIDPSNLFSYQSSGIEERFYTSVKLVIDPGETEEVSFIVYCTPGKYGWREALSRYYEIFPELFTPRNDIDPRFFGVGETSGYMLNYEASELLMEDRRRFYTQWNWSMHAYEKIGLLYPRENDFCPNGTFIDKSLQGLPREKFLQVVREAYQRSNQNSATAYYILPQVLDKETAENDFSDSIWLTSHGQTIIADFAAESHREKAEAFAVLPAGNSYGKRAASDLPEIASDIKPHGIAFDNVEGPRMDFANHAENCQGRAFAEDKVYVTQAIGYAELMRIVRELPSEGRKMAVLGNHPGSYHTATLTDTAIIEHGPWTDPESALALRFAMGTKPIVYWGPKEFSGCKTLVGKELIDKLDYLNHWLFLFSLRTGILPNAAINIKGYPKMLERIPLLLKIARAGWQPVSGAKCEAEDVTIERFGKEYLTIVNETESQLEAEITVETSYFLPGTESFRPVYGKIENQNFKDGTIKIKLQVPSMNAIVLCSGKVEEPSDTIEISVEEKFILNFPFIDNGHSNCQIVIADTHTDEEYYLARRIAAYFKYYSLQTRYGNEPIPYYYQVYHLQDLIKKNDAVEIPIVKWSKRSLDMSSIRLQLDPDLKLPESLPRGKSGLISIKNRTLNLIGNSIDSLEETTLRLLRLLDKKYVFHGKRWFEMRREQNAVEAALMSALEP